MKKILLFLILMNNMNTQAQSNFEGTIDYKMVSADGTAEMKITAIFKKDKIKIISEVVKRPEKAQMNDETIILDFEEGFIDRIKVADRIVERELMVGKGNRQNITDLIATGESGTILGHICATWTTGVVPQAWDTTGAGTKLINICYADDLQFRVPEQMKMVQMVPMFTNGHIALATELKITSAGFELTLITTAVGIEAAKVPVTDSIFGLPVGYSLKYKD